MKDPKTKAQELIEKYKPIVSIWDSSDQEILKDAVECAFICIEEKIETFIRCCGGETHNYTGRELDDFQELVTMKIEIMKFKTT